MKNKKEQEGDDVRRRRHRCKYIAEVTTKEAKPALDAGYNSTPVLSRQLKFARLCQTIYSQ
jgi:hypothetical protein